MEKLNFDVVICGGGPGGSACAMGFAGTDIKVAVIEKGFYPREKVCGDGMAPYIPKALQKMSPVFRDAFDGFKERIPVNKIRIVSFNEKSVCLDLPEPWFVATRFHFDEFLYRQAASLPNVTYFCGEQVTGVEVDEDKDKATVSTSKGRQFQAKLVVGCDGSSSLVRRQLTNYKLSPSYHCAAVRAYYSGVKDLSNDVFEFFFIPQYPGGYFWIFPSEDGTANVGFGIFSKEASDKQLNIREVFLEIIRTNSELKARFASAELVGEVKGWGIPIGYGTHPISGLRFMLTGDAASVADPLTGEGIGQAIVTGRIAAFHAKKCFERDDFSARMMRGYDRAVDLKWGKQNRRRRFTSNMISRMPAILNILVSSLGSNSSMGRLLGKTIARFIG
jgi:geranylgeranyl reductase family protein